ncbi:hypothetical protein I302_102737 [Kwoniella bestiolae CBS 10118]|uniref:Uncharacterized protein n=1 Tax=Kwoniella bestiolae CBS 10118 TaxID=1296100 RepID=A0A1B9GFX9_9TREE|nr:hypothetical protein I302_01430 [Kwoniella bestiolae CBS 10118]OCF29917.1 hypothetical protein I302_01430 [Kwoniella bestiolae CBS 10118]
MTLTPTFTGPVLVTSGKGTISETLRKTEKAISWLDRAIQGTELGGNILSIYSLPIPLNIGPLVHCLKQMLEFVRSGLENQVDALNLVIDCYNHVNSLRTQLMCRVGSPSLVIQNVVDGLTQKLQKNVDLLAALSNQSSLKRMWRSTQSRRSLIAAREDTCRYLDEINLQLNIMQSQKLDQQHDLIYGLTKRIAQLERAFRGSDLVAGSARMLYVDRYTLVIQEEEAEFCKLLGCLNGPNFPDTRLMVGDLKLRIIDSFSQMPWKGNRLEILGFLINLAILYQLLSAKIAPLIETENIAQGMPIYFVQQ